MAAETRENLTKGSTWTRLIYILLFTITFNVAEVVIAVVTIVQFFTVLITGGAPNKRLQDLGRMLGLYARQVISFLTYESDDKPFPIGDWPESTSGNKNEASGKVAKAT